MTRPGGEDEVLAVVAAAAAHLEQADRLLWMVVRAALVRGVPEDRVLDVLGVSRASMYRRLRRWGLVSRRGGKDHPNGLGGSG